MDDIKSSHSDNGSVRNKGNNIQPLQEEDSSDKTILGAVGESTADDLKDTFIEGYVPREEDYAALIDLAEAGRKALGYNETSHAPGPGLIITADVLAVNPYVDGGLEVSSPGVGVKQSDTIGSSTSGTNVIPDTTKGIKVGTGGVEAFPDINNGINVDANGIAIIADTNKGMTVGVDGVTLIPDSGKAVQLGSTGVGVIGSDSILVDTAGIAVIPNTAKAVSVGASGVEIATGRGLTIENGLLIAINQITTGPVFPTSAIEGDIHYTNVGDMWESLPYGLNSGMPSSVTDKGSRVLAESSIFIAFFQNGLVSTSRDKGRTWLGFQATKRGDFKINTTIPTMSFKDGKAVYAVDVAANDSKLMVSYNADYGWRAITLPTNTTGNYNTVVSCASQIFAAGTMGCHKSSSFRRETLEENDDLPVAMSNDIIHCLSSRNNIIFSSGVSGRTAISFNCGFSWAAKTAFSDSTARSYTAINSDEVIVASTSAGPPIYSDDYGATWTTGIIDVMAPTDDIIHGVYSYDSTFYFSSRSSGTYCLYQSIDGGVNWSIVTGIPSSNYFFTGVSRTKDSFILTNNEHEAWGSYKEKYVYYNGQWQLSS